MGDSQMQGLAPHLMRLLEARHHEIVGTGIRSGWSVSRFIGATVSVPDADLVLVALGGNDSPVNQEAYRTAIAEFLVKYVRSRPVKIVWWGPAYSTDSRVRAQHDRNASMQRAIFADAARLRRERGITDIALAWHDSRPVTQYLEHSPDGVHFTRAGYEKWAARIAGELEPTSIWTWIGVAIAGLFGIKLLRAGIEP